MPSLRYAEHSSLVQLDSGLDCLASRFRPAGRGYVVVPSAVRVPFPR